jgi:hypothetical protein
MSATQGADSEEHRSDSNVDDTETSESEQESDYLSPSPPTGPLSMAHENVIDSLMQQANGLVRDRVRSGKLSGYHTSPLDVKNLVANAVRMTLEMVRRVCRDEGHVYIHNEEYERIQQKLHDVEDMMEAQGSDPFGEESFNTPRRGGTGHRGDGGGGGGGQGDGDEDGEDEHWRRTPKRNRNGGPHDGLSPLSSGLRSPPIRPPTRSAAQQDAYDDALLDVELWQHEDLWFEVGYWDAPFVTLIMQGLSQQVQGESGAAKHDQQTLLATMKHVFRDIVGRAPTKRDQVRWKDGLDRFFILWKAKFDLPTDSQQAAGAAKAAGSAKLRSNAPKLPERLRECSKEMDRIASLAHVGATSRYIGEVSGLGLGSAGKGLFGGAYGKGGGGGGKGGKAERWRQRKDKKFPDKDKDPKNGLFVSHDKRTCHKCGKTGHMKDKCPN